MPFPKKERIVYEKNPLDEVVCQLRFPPILRIDSEIPVEFQEKIRKDFPKFTETVELKVELSSEASPPIPPEMLQNFIKGPGNRNYEFLSEDGLWKINLTRTFLALSSYKYQRWEEFREMLLLPFKALIEVYSPIYFSRLGLRYIDVIKRSNLNLEKVSWRELLNPFILGVIGSSEVGNNVFDFENNYRLNLSDNGSIVRIITKFVKSKESDEIYYMIDSDFFNPNKTLIDDAFSKLDYFHISASNLIQWCITDTLSNAMKPEKI